MTFVFCLKYIEMKQISPLILILLLAASCTSQKKLAYLQNLPEPTGQESFPMEIPDYKLQPRDILYITAKAMTPDGTIKDFLQSANNSGSNIAREMPEALYMDMMLIQRVILQYLAVGNIMVSGLNT